VACALCGFSREAAAHDGHVRVKVDGFSFVPPSGWERSSNLTNMQLRLVYMGPTQRNFRANLNLVVDKDTGESFDEVSKQFKEMFPKLLSDWKLVEEAPMEIGGRPAYYVSATYRMAGSTLQNAQFVVRGGNGKAYTLTFTATRDAFEALQPAIATSAMSIRIE
jgi:hypothetical protein